MTIVTLPNFHRYSPDKGGWKVPEGQRIKFVSGQGYHTEPIPGFKPAAAPAAQPTTLDGRVNAILDKQFGTSTSLIAKQAAQLQAEAAARQQNYQAAYAAAAKSNAAMGADVQAGWNQAGSAVQGLAGALTGGIGAETQQGVASVDQALANVGAPATQYDPSTQAGVESYYGGYLPGRQFAQLGGIGRQFMDESGIGLNTRGLQESLATQKQTNFEILKNQTQALADIAAKRPDAYQQIRSLFATEKQNTVANNIAKQELAARIRQEHRDLQFKYDELRQNAKTEAERNRLTKEQNKLDRAIDKQNADATTTNAATSAYQAHHPTPSGSTARYTTGTYQQKLAAVIQDELQNVQNTYIPKKDDGTGLLKYGPNGAVIKKANGTAVVLPYTKKRWVDNQRIRYREHMFQNLWPMIEGNIAYGNKKVAMKYLRNRLNKIALSWDPHTAYNDSLGSSASTVPTLPNGTATGTNTTIHG